MNNGDDPVCNATQSLLRTRRKTRGCDNAAYLQGAGKVLDFLYNTWQDQKLCDVLVTASGGSVQAHRVALGAYSDALNKTFFNYNCGDMIKLDLSDFRSDVVMAILHFLYTTELDLNCHIIGQVLACANELGMSTVMQLCIDYMSDLNVNNVVLHYSIAENNCITDLRDKAFNFILENFSDVSVTRHFLYLPFERLSKILCSDNICVNSELDVFSSVMRWIDFDPPRRQRCAYQLFKSVRFAKLTPESLVKEVESVNWLFNDPECMKDFLYMAMKYNALQNTGSRLASQLAPKERVCLKKPGPEPDVSTGEEPSRNLGPSGDRQIKGPAVGFPPAFCLLPPRPPPPPPAVISSSSVSRQHLKSSVGTPKDNSSFQDDSQVVEQNYLNTTRPPFVPAAIPSYPTAGQGGLPYAPQGYWTPTPGYQAGMVYSFPGANQGFPVATPVYPGPAQVYQDPSGYPGFQGRPSSIAGQNFQGQPSPLDGQTLQGRSSYIVGQGFQGQPSPITADQSLQARPSAIPGQSLQGQPSPIADQGLQGQPSPIADQGLQGQPSPIADQSLQGRTSPLDGQTLQGQPPAMPGQSLQGQPSAIPSQSFQGQSSAIDDQNLQGRQSSLDGQTLQGRPSSTVDQSFQGRPSSIVGQSFQGQPPFVFGQGFQGGPVPVVGQSFPGSPTAIFAQNVPATSVFHRRSSSKRQKASVRQSTPTEANVTPQPVQPPCQPQCPPPQQPVERLTCDRQPTCAASSSHQQVCPLSRRPAELPLSCDHKRHQSSAAPCFTSPRRHQTTEQPWPSCPRDRRSPAQQRQHPPLSRDRDAASRSSSRQRHHPRQSSEHPLSRDRDRPFGAFFRLPSRQRHDQLQQQSPSHGHKKHRSSARHSSSPSRDPNRLSPAAQMSSEFLSLVAVGGIDLESVDPDAPGKLISNYNVQSNSWRVLSDRMTKFIHHHGVGTIDGKLYIVGGAVYDNSQPENLGVATNEMIVYDPASRVWSTGAPMNVARSYLAIAVWRNLLLVAGGEDEDKQKLDSVESYDPTANSWTALTQLPGGPKVGAAAAVCHDCLFVIGGYNREREEGAILGDVECYDLIGQRWSILAPLKIPRCHSCLAEVNNRLFLIAGRSSFSTQSTTSLSSVEEYNFSNDTWVRVGNLEQSRHDAGCAVVGSRIFVIGGIRNQNTSCMQSVECFDTSAGTWIKGIDKLPHPITGTACCAIYGLML